MKGKHQGSVKGLALISDSKKLKNALIWVVAPIAILLMFFLTSRVLGHTKIINAGSNSALLPSGLRVDLICVVKKTGDSSDPSRKETWKPDGTPLAAGRADEEGLHSAAPDMMSVGNYEPEETRYLVFKITSPSGRLIDISGFIPGPEFDRSKPSRSGICKCSLNLSLEEGGSAAFESQVACGEPKLDRYILEISDVEWVQAADVKAVPLEGKNGESKDVKLQFGLLHLSVHRYSDYSGPERSPDYVRLEVLPEPSVSKSEYRIQLYDVHGSLLQFPYGLKRGLVPNQTDFPIDLWNTVGRIEIQKRSTEFVEFTDIPLNHR